MSSFYPDGAHIHITNKDVSKGEGVRYVKNALGLSTEDCLGVGAVSYTHLDVYKRQI